MYEIQMFDCRLKHLTWSGIAGGIKGIKAAEEELSFHEEDWPNIQFRIMRAESL